MELAERLTLLGSRDTAALFVAVFDIADGSTLRATVSSFDADWVALAPAETRGGAVLVPFAATVAVGTSSAHLEHTARPARLCSPITDRPTLVSSCATSFADGRASSCTSPPGRALAGTIDGAGMGHLHLALHEAMSPQPADTVAGYRIVPFAVVACIHADKALSPLTPWTADGAVPQSVVATAQVRVSDIPDAPELGEGGRLRLLQAGTIPVRALNARVADAFARERSGTIQPAQLDAYPTGATLGTTFGAGTAPSTR